MMQVYIVKGTWPFPRDMLRHDQSKPASPDDLLKIERYSVEFVRDKRVFDPVEIQLVGPCKPNTARWESFGWEVITDEDYKIDKAIALKAKAQMAVVNAAKAKLTDDEWKAVVDHVRFGGM